LSGRDGSEKQDNGPQSKNGLLILIAYRHFLKGESIFLPATLFRDYPQLYPSSAAVALIRRFDKVYLE